MITIIVGTNRNGSYSKRVADIYHKILSDNGVKCQMLDLKMLPHDFIFTQLQTQTDDYTAFITEYILNAQKFIFIIPEYNGSFPGVLKAFIDTVPPKFFRDKRSCLVGVSSGHFGAVRGLDDFTDILHYLGVEVLSNKPKFSSIETLLDQNNEFLSPVNKERVEKQLEQFESF
jgi:chromate reductase, NAD(P)H dehydrogenase (quinone)